MTRSVGDLSCVSHKSLTWAIEEAGGEVPNQELSDDTHKGSHRDGESKGTCTLYVIPYLIHCS